MQHSRLCAKFYPQCKVSCRASFTLGQKVNKPQIKKGGVKGAMDIAVSTATRVHKQMCMEQNLPTTAEKLKQKSAERKQWLLDNQHALLSHDLTIKEIAQNFNLTQSQIKWARIDLKKLLNIPKKPLAIVWVRAHQADLEQLSHVELQNKYQMTQGQVRHALRVLKKLKQNET